MKPNTKMLNLSIQFHTKEEAINQLNDVIRQLRLARTNYERKLKNGCVLEWGISQMEEPIEYRVELINGKQCFVIPSKMNQL